VVALRALLDDPGVIAELQALGFEPAS